MKMRGQSLVGFLISIVIIFLVISFAITLLPYILLGFGIWYFYRRLIRPLFSGTTGESYKRKEENYYRSYSEPTVKENEPPVTQVKSVHDDTFFSQDHKVVDVDYDEEVK